MGGTETILVADDGAGVRGVLRHMLEGAGYQVLLAEDGESAVRLFRECADRVDLVILDVIMPVMNGVEASRHMKAIKSDIRYLFTSGYTSGAIQEMSELDEPV